MKEIARIPGAGSGWFPPARPWMQSSWVRSLPIGRAPELAEVEGRAQQGPLALDLGEPPQQELAKPQGLFQLPEDRLRRGHELAVVVLAPLSPHPPVAALAPRQARRRATARGGRQGAATAHAPGWPKPPDA